MWNEYDGLSKIRWVWWLLVEGEGERWNLILKGLGKRDSSLVRVKGLQPKTPPLCGGRTRQQSATLRHHNQRDTSETTHVIHTSPRSFHPLRSAQVRCSRYLLPSEPVLLFPYSRGFTPLFFTRLFFLCSFPPTNQEWAPTSALFDPLPLLQDFLLVQWFSCTQDPCSFCGIRVHAFLCMLCEQLCQRRCVGICSSADYQRLAPHLRHWLLSMFTSLQHYSAPGNTPQALTISCMTV